MKKLFVYLSMISILILPAHPVMAGNKKAEKKETLAVHASTILMIATAYVGIDFVATCTDEPSAILFAMGGLFFIFGEIKNWNNYKESSDRIVKDYDTLDVEKKQAQIEALQKAEDQTRNAASAARERASNAKTAATMFTVAAIVALIEGILDAIPWITYDDACSGGMSSSSGSNNYLKKIISPFMNLLAPELQAKVDTTTPAALGIVSAAALASFATVRTGLKEVMSSIKDSGFLRAVVFAGFAILANEVKSMTEKAADIYDDQADAYAKIKNKLISSLSKISFEGYKEMMFDYDKIKLEQERVDLKINCATASNGADFTMDANCSCRKTNSCKNVGRPKLNFKKINVPGAVTSTLDDFSSMATASYAANDEKAVLAQNKIGANASRLREIRKELEVASNKSLVANGATPIDFSKNAKYFAKLIKDKTRSSLNKNTLNELANVFGSPAPSDELLSKKSKDNLNDYKKKMKQISSPRTFKKKSSGKGNPFDNLLLMTDLQNKEALDTAGELAKYKTNTEQDIHKKKSTSIFKIISNRYLKTAFPAFFDEK